jgi:hypothetical protein
VATLKPVASLCTERLPTNETTVDIDGLMRYEPSNQIGDRETEEKSKKERRNN